MTIRRLPRSQRGRALPRGDNGTVTWPRALHGRSTVLCLLLLGWLGGGLLATLFAAVTMSPDDLTYGLAHATAACAALLLVAVAPRVALRRDRAPGRTPLRLGGPVPVPVPAQDGHDHDDRREPALR